MKKKPTPPEPRTAEQVNAPQCGVVTLKEIEQEHGKDWESEFQTRAASSMLRPMAPGQNSIALIVELLAHMRHKRDHWHELYLKEDTEGCHSFREWCMKQFGERLGGWVEEML